MLNQSVWEDGQFTFLSLMTSFERKMPEITHHALAYLA